MFLHTDNWKYSPWKFRLCEVFRCKLGKYKAFFPLPANLNCINAYFHRVIINIYDLQNFVDLAGSERASQTHADGARLREGCHINLSLMTLTTVIRKLRSESTITCFSVWIRYRHLKACFHLEPCSICLFILWALCNFKSCIGLYKRSTHLPNM